MIAIEFMMRFAFNRGSFMKFLKKSDKIHLLMTLEKNNFMGVETIQFMVKDMIKERMPISDLLRMRFDLAMKNFLVNADGYGTIDNFTSIDSFDIIFSVPNKKPILIYSEEGLIKFKDKVLANNYINYTLHFNQFNSKESREGFWDIIILPIAPGVSDAYYFISATNDLELYSHIPDRNDLALFYKYAINKEESTLQLLSNKGTLSIAKCRICLSLLSEMNLLHYKENGNYVKLNWLPRPTEKIDIEQLELYKNLIKKWRK